MVFHGLRSNYHGCRDIRWHKVLQEREAKKGLSPCCIDQDDNKRSMGTRNKAKQGASRGKRFSLGRAG